MKKTVLIIFSSILAAGVIIFGFLWYFFPPFQHQVLIIVRGEAKEEAKMHQATQTNVRDVDRISDGKMIQAAAEFYAQNKGACPDSLAALKEDFSYVNMIDRVFKVEYEYIKSGDKDCQICFNLEVGVDGYTVGRNCLKALVK